jgi:hypothetical protein
MLQQVYIKYVIYSTYSQITPYQVAIALIDILNPPSRTQVEITTPREEVDVTLPEEKTGNPLLAGSLSFYASLCDLCPVSCPDQRNTGSSA